MLSRLFQGDLEESPTHPSCATVLEPEDLLVCGMVVAEAGDQA